MLSLRLSFIFQKFPDSTKIFFKLILKHEMLKYNFKNNLFYTNVTFLFVAVR